MAVKQNRLLSAREREESSFLVGELFTMFVRFVGSGGNEGAIHFPLLQQNARSSPSSRCAPHLSHDLLQLGVRHLHRFMERPNLTHQGSEREPCSLMSDEKRGNGAHRE